MRKIKKKKKKKKSQSRGWKLRRARGLRGRGKGVKGKRSATWRNPRDGGMVFLFYHLLYLPREKAGVVSRSLPAICRPIRKQPVCLTTSSTLILYKINIQSTITFNATGPPPIRSPPQ